MLCRNEKGHIKNHRSEFPVPLIVKQGEKVIIGEESSVHWHDWVFCTKIDGSNKGWVPKHIIKYEHNYGNIIEDYSAKELDSDTGTVVEGIRECNGWLWLKNKKTNEMGWVPMDKLQKLE